MIFSKWLYHTDFELVDFFQILLIFLKGIASLHCINRNCIASFLTILLSIYFFFEPHVQNVKCLHANMFIKEDVFKSFSV